MIEFDQDCAALRPYLTILLLDFAAFYDVAHMPAHEWCAASFLQISSDAGSPLFRIEACQYMVKVGELKVHYLGIPIDD